MLPYSPTHSGMRLDAAAAVAVPPSAAAKASTGLRRRISASNTPGRRRSRTAAAAAAAIHCNVSATKAPSSAPPTVLHLSNLQRVLRYSPTKSSHVGDETASALDMASLDLSGVLPAAKKPSELSPKWLPYLRRLLSDSPTASPKGIISHRWRDLHGSGDWSGLLDPLDEDLRREVVRYGEHVQAAYHAFHHEEGRRVAVPDGAYRVTEHLHATSSLAPPPWFRQERSSWVGYVAVCDDHCEIRRSGRRDIVVALRGTATCLEWAENLRDVLVPMPPRHDGAGERLPRVECGFLSLFRTTPPEKQQRKSLSCSVADEILRLMEAYPGEDLSITVTGHSLGAALALLVADHLSVCAPEMPPITVFSFGGPRVGDRGFADRISRRGVKVLRVVNEHDVVTRVPGVFASEAVDRKLRRGAAKRVMDALDEHMPWAYSHVGNELRVDSRRSPYLRSDADLGCCHDLEAYLHLVDGFLSSHIPFRRNAKRSIVRLMRLQGSKLKKLCNSKKSTLVSKPPLPPPESLVDHRPYETASSLK